MIHLESDAMRVELDPAFGARVTALWDKRGREWLVTGPRDGEPGDTAPYGGAQSRGWDECFPTITPCQHPAWGLVRDHGLLWGRPWKVAAHGARAKATYAEERFRFTRVLELHGGALLASYEWENLSGRPLPWMWAQHCLLAARPGDRLALEGLEGLRDEAGPVGWPVHRGRDLSAAEGPEAGFMLKAYADAPGAARAELRGEGGGLALSWEGVPAFGLWISWGGWDGQHQMAFEPATAPVDGLDLAVDPPVLPPGERAAWAVTVGLT